MAICLGHARTDQGFPYTPRFPHPTLPLSTHTPYVCSARRRWSTPLVVVGGITDRLAPQPCLLPCVPSRRQRAAADAPRADTYPRRGLQYAPTANLSCRYFTVRTPPLSLSPCLVSVRTRRYLLGALGVHSVVVPSLGNVFVLATALWVSVIVKPKGSLIVESVTRVQWTLSLLVEIWMSFVL